MRSGAAARLKRRNEPSRGKADAPAEQSSIRIAKAMARAGLCSRREAERWIADGRVVVNGRRIETPAVDVGPNDKVVVDGKPLPAAEPVRLWRYHKPRGLVTTHADPEGRSTVFDNLPAELPRVISIGRLDLNTEGLLLLTNDGALARHLELPATGWLRRYRVRAHGRVTQEELDKLKDGVEIEGVRYGPVEATLDTLQGGNIWLTISLREGKNREVRRILESLGLAVNRLIRISYGPFQLLDLKPGEAEVVRRRVLADQLGPSLAEAFRLTGPDQDEVQRRRARRESNAQEPVPEATEPAGSEMRKGGGVDRPKDKALSLAKRRRRRLEAEASGGRWGAPKPASKSAKGRSERDGERRREPSGRGARPDSPQHAVRDGSTRKGRSTPQGKSSASGQTGTRESGLPKKANAAHLRDAHSGGGRTDKPRSFKPRSPGKKPFKPRER